MNIEEAWARIEKEIRKDENDARRDLPDASAVLRRTIAKKIQEDLAALAHAKT